MSVPLWFFIACLAVVGVKLVRPPLWLVAVLLVGGSILAPAIDPFVK